MEPGIIGLPQVGSRPEAYFDARALLDLAYIDRWSLLPGLEALPRMALSFLTAGTAARGTP